MMRWIPDKVDGSNPAPVDMANMPLFCMILYIPGGCLGFLPSRVLQGYSWSFDIFKHHIQVGHSSSSGTPQETMVKKVSSSQHGWVTSGLRIILAQKKRIFF